MQFNLVGNLFETAHQHFVAGRLVDAESCCRQALMIDPQHSSSLYLMGNIAGEAGHPDLALEYFDRVLAVGPNVAEAHGNRGVALMTLGRLDEAERALRRSMELDPRRAEPWYALGNLKASQDEHQAAFEAFLRSLEIDPRDGRAWTNMGIALHHMGKFDDAMAAYQRAATILPDAPLVHYNVAVTLHALGRIDESLSANYRALELDPHYVAAHSNLLIAMTYRAGYSAADLLSAHRTWDEVQAQPLAPAAQAAAE